MSVTITLTEQTAEHLDDLRLPDTKADADSKVRALLEAEYRRQLARHTQADRVLSEKYGVSFEEFQHQHLVEQAGYAWEAESDASEWEFALSGIRTARRKLTGLLGKTPDEDR